MSFSTWLIVLRPFQVRGILTGPKETIAPIALAFEVLLLPANLADYQKGPE